MKYNGFEFTTLNIPYWIPSEQTSSINNDLIFDYFQFLIKTNRPNSFVLITNPISAIITNSFSYLKQFAKVSTFYEIYIRNSKICLEIHYPFKLNQTSMVKYNSFLNILLKINIIPQILIIIVIGA